MAITTIKIDERFAIAAEFLESTFLILLTDDEITNLVIRGNDVTNPNDDGNVEESKRRF